MSLPPIYDWGINLIIALQAGAPWLQAPMQFFSFLGTEEFFLFFLPFLYWCVDVRLGVRVGVMLSLSNSVNGFFKLAFHQPRPYWLSTQVLPGVSETSYGIPSGHAQHAAAIWGVVGSSGTTWLRWRLRLRGWFAPPAAPRPTPEWLCRAPRSATRSGR